MSAERYVIRLNRSLLNFNSRKLILVFKSIYLVMINRFDGFALFFLVLKIQKRSNIFNYSTF